MANDSQSDFRPLARATLGGLFRLLPCLLIVVFVGSHQSRLFGTTDYQLAVHRLLAGENFYGYINYDERAFERDMARGLKTPITVLVAGSSRTMQLESDCFDGPYFNASVSAAMVPDLVAMVEEFRRGRELKHVVIGADPWIMNEPGRFHYDDMTRMQAAPDWVRGQLWLGLKPAWDDWLGAAKAELEPFREILAPYSFQAAWRIFLYGRPRLPADLPNLFRKEPDGSLRYADFFVNVSEAKAVELARQGAEAHVPSVYANFWRIDPALSKAFEAMTGALQKSGVRITIVVAPFHPVYYDFVTHNGGGKMVPAVEDYFRQLAKEHGYEIIGSYDPAKAGVTAADFFDGGHLKKATLKRLYGCPLPPRP